MQIKTFRAANLQAALDEIRAQLGPEASVLRTRQRRDGWMGWLGRSYVEVEAVATDAASSESSESSQPNLLAAHEANSAIDSLATAPSGRYRIHDADSSASTRIPGLVASNAPTSAEPLMMLQRTLDQCGIPAQVTKRWLQSANAFMAGTTDTRGSLAGLDQYRQQLELAITRELSFSGPIQASPGTKRTVALVGPTGVGKTTTIAKLAAGFGIQQGCKVGLLTLDTFRIAAVDQLQAYAELMRLPMHVARSSTDLSDSIAQLGNVDLVLIDSVGRSPSGDSRLGELSQMLSSVPIDETHLVISATSTYAVVKSVIEGFRVTRPNAAILTKLDETPYTAGAVAAIAAENNDRWQQQGQLPISYITYGQNVPDDIAVASSEKLGHKLLPAAHQITQLEAA
ncbi:MAG: flagellar biosynthesis protein FlhF [Rhodopirellula sp. TMED11]|nr:MAG: flagellar biosynthesis protein FlhF [Rhodopirellula sp. TMED11]